ncbi:bifunctional protein-serine/threonine kinase/phosphatase [Sulfuriflexus mobilis]|uniref:bifunctional protein-serine/threonine kinase/phosphatase n=1 Tax=Sulfuriflexus mobilis TaxID=1811807 RepID=UPI0018D593C4|nr:bifunctional protein-serine/threonine kinase/phosphatase [Sulfuriflexus mobilis]
MMQSQPGIQSGQCSEAGVKAINDDACDIRIPDEPLLSTKGIVALIADGVSRSEAGREASHACVRGFLSDYYSTPDSWSVKNAGQKIIGSLNTWLYSQAQRKYDSDRAMLTTLSSLVIKSGTAHIFHVGDTRIYRLRDNDLECLTQDHRVWGSGEKTYLGRAMGADSHIDIDYRSLPVEVGDLYLLATDGIYEFISDSELKRYLREGREMPEATARKIVTRALEGGSNDNATCQILRVDHLPELDEEAFYRQLTELPFPPFLEAGMVLDGYRITREIHASSRTQVYAAQDVATGQRVILKTPSVNYEDDPAYIEQFLHEEWIGRRINNSHVLKVIVPTRRRRFLYYVTEYIEGQTLREWMQENTRPSYIAVRNILEQIAGGLRAFHKLEMLHRDLKPENIMFDDSGRLIIIDFGSTRVAGIDEKHAPFERDNILGTLDYAAPEFFEGYAGSTYSDIYSLGVIAYEMLTGHLPYKRALTAKRLSQARYTPVKHYTPEVPAWVDAAIHKAVNLKPEKRYTRLSEFIHDLGTANPNFINKEPVPLMQRNPLAFWKTFALLLLFTNLALIIYIFK